MDENNLDQRDVHGYLQYSAYAVEVQDMIAMKRELLRFSALIFDLLGIFAPAALPLKIIFQKMCKEKSY